MKKILIVLAIVIVVTLIGYRLFVYMSPRVAQKQIDTVINDIDAEDITELSDLNSDEIDKEIDEVKTQDETDIDSVLNSLDLELKGIDPSTDFADFGTID